MSFGDPGRSPRPAYIPQVASRDPAETPARPICGRSRTGCRHPLPTRIRKAWFAASLLPPPGRRQDKLRLLRLRTRLPVARVSPGRRFSLHPARGGDVRLGAAGELPDPGLAHSPVARGFWKAALRSIAEIS